MCKIFGYVPMGRGSASWFAVKSMAFACNAVSAFNWHDSFGDFVCLNGHLPCRIGADSSGGVMYCLYLNGFYRGLCRDLHFR